ncbi:hypothetical protein IFR04_009057 [Cadophora malorum]|uniref:Uncharacterized protein n=1 Tax=Cadophora malorum TaxID=108018 RepID=A0A8H7TA10_9HELO|nr:hypothetical protein IFR04_009057 [Cadophora malorum]
MVYAERRKDTTSLAKFFSPRNFDETTKQADRKKEIRRCYTQKDVEGDDTEKGKEIDTSDVEVDDDESIGIEGIEETCKETDEENKKEDDDGIEREKNLEVEK